MAREATTAPAISSQIVRITGGELGSGCDGGTSLSPPFLMYGSSEVEDEVCCQGKPVLGLPWQCASMPPLACFPMSRASVMGKMIQCRIQWSTQLSPLPQSTQGELLWARGPFCVGLIVDFGVGFWLLHWVHLREVQCRLQVARYSVRFGHNHCGGEIQGGA